ncbi:MAG TPA: hypothetical protein VKV32_12875 [Stellaceae bacterium]|nr:hypothetical protein [Stellaceae bacterium]
MMRRLIPALLSLALVCAAVAPSFAQQTATAPVRLRGEITHIDRDAITIKTPQGQPATVLLDPNATVMSVKPARLADIKPGRFVGTAAMPETNGRWRAMEVHIFPPGSRLGEGHRPYNPTPGATMTNADVTAAVVKARTGMLTLTTGGQNYDIDVPPTTPIVSMSPGTRALVKKGAYVIINQAMPGAGGAYSAKQITVTTARNWPPA